MVAEMGCGKRIPTYCTKSGVTPAAFQREASVEIQERLAAPWARQREDPVDDVVPVSAPPPLLLAQVRPLLLGALQPEVEVLLRCVLEISAVVGDLGWLRRANFRYLTRSGRPCWLLTHLERRVELLLLHLQDRGVERNVHFLADRLGDGVGRDRWRWAPEAGAQDATTARLEQPKRFAVHARSHVRREALAREDE